MPLFKGNYYAMAPIWGEKEFEADDKDQFEFLLKQEVHDLYPEVEDVEIRDVSEIV